MTETIDVLKVQEKINKIITDRDKFVIEANRQVAAFDGAITALQQLINPEPTPVEMQDNKP